MVQRDIERRVQALEARNADRSGYQFYYEHGIPMLKREDLQGVFLALRLGGYREGEDPAEGHARSLGYANRQDLERARLRDADEVRRRHEDALDRLFAAEGLDRATADGRAKAALINRLVAAAPQELNDRLWFELQVDDHGLGCSLSAILDPVWVEGRL